MGYLHAVLNNTHCPTVLQEDLGANEEGEGAGLVPQTGYLELKDSAGHTEMAVVSAEEVMRQYNSSNFALV